MPVTLPQLSRRQFLKRAALAGTVAALAPESYAGWFGKSRDAHTFAFVSDVHIAADAREVHGGVNMADNFSACAREIAHWRVKPAAIIVNGDLALAYGKPEDYATFGRLVTPLRAIAPVHLSLGNHDNRDHFWQAFPQDAVHMADVPGKQVSVFSSDRANWFLVDSLDVTSETPGDLGSAQLHWLAQELVARPDKPAIVVCHHPLDLLGLLGLKDTAAVENLFAHHRQIKAFVFGHTHNWHVETHPSGVHLINLPQTAYPFVVGRPSGWVRAALARGGADFELRCLDPHHPEQGEIKSLTWRT